MAITREENLGYKLTKIPDGLKAHLDRADQVDHLGFTYDVASDDMRFRLIVKVSHPETGLCVVNTVTHRDAFTNDSCLPESITKAREALKVALRDLEAKKEKDHHENKNEKEPSPELLNRYREACEKKFLEKFAQGCRISISEKEAGRDPRNDPGNGKPYEWDSDGF